MSENLQSSVEQCIRNRLAELQSREAAKNDSTDKPPPPKKKTDKKTADSGSKKTKVTSISFRDALATIFPFAHPMLLSHSLAKSIEGRETDLTSKIDNKPVDLDGDDKLDHLTLLCTAGVECIKIVSHLFFYLFL